MQPSLPQDILVRHYESCFAKHGDRPEGVDWPNAADAKLRHQIMLEVIHQPGLPTSILDFGCGLGHLYETVQEMKLDWVDYTGLDLSTQFIETCVEKFPGVRFLSKDILKAPLTQTFDYILCNGVFTEKREVDHDEFLDYLMKVLRSLTAHCRKGIAFNVMSKCVDWERDDLFHVSIDKLLPRLTRDLSRHVVFRHDYGLYEYSVYVYRAPNAVPPRDLELSPGPSA